MRIDGPGSRKVEPAGSNPGRPEVSISGPTSDVTENSSHSVSPELKALHDQVGLLPEVRPDVVAEATRRLNSGELSSKETVSRTAEAILGDALRVA